MKNLQKMGGVAALYMAASYLVGIVIFLVVLDYANIVDPAQKVALLAEKEMVIFVMNLILYVIFGVFLTIFVLALYERLKGDAPAMMQVSTVLGIIWAGSLIASGMISNAGITPTLALYGTDPEQAALTWQNFEIVASGLGNGNGEILGGLMTLLISWAAFASGKFPKFLNYLGVIVGLVGMVSIIPDLTDLVGLFGIGQVIWFVWLAMILFQERNLPRPI